MTSTPSELLKILIQNIKYTKWTRENL